MTTGFTGKRVGLDIIGPLTISVRGFEYILVMVDYFTKWVEATPLLRQDATSVANAITQVNKLLDELLQAKILQPSSSPWASPIALVPKKDGSVRLCIDYRRLNALTVRDSFPLPRLDDTLDALGNAAWFLTLDLKSAATFQRLMYRVLQPLIPDKCLIYLDDITVFGRSIDEHNHNLRAVLEALQSAGLTLNPSKLAFVAGLTPKSDFQKVSEVLLQLFASPDASALANQRFATLRQRPDQSVDDFVHDLRRLAAAAFTDRPESDRDRFILHQFITGLRDRTASGVLLLHPPASLSSAIQQCRLYEECYPGATGSPHRTNSPTRTTPPPQQTTFHFTSAIP
ncbi:hypothetical protein SprV_0301347600 [Sparganum proliferum]